MFDTWRRLAHLDSAGNQKLALAVRLSPQEPRLPSEAEL